jgi:phosphopantetheine--protein transferase-like protein
MLVPGVGTIGVYGGVVPPPPSVGIDLVDVRDVARSVERFGARYLSRVYTDAEIAYAQAAKETRGVASRLGARFAAKEATLKAATKMARSTSPCQARQLLQLEKRAMRRSRSVCRTKVTGPSRS